MLIVLGAMLGIFFGLFKGWDDTAPVQYRGWHDPGKTIRDKGETFRSMLFFSVVLGVLGTVIGALVSLAVYSLTVDEAPRRFDIVSLGDASGSEGRAFLGSGSVDTEAVFFYYAPRKNGGYGLFNVDANQTTIYEDQTNSGYLIKYCADAWTAPDWLLGKPDESDRYDCSSASKFEFHIPKNSIVRNFNLDAQ